MNWSGPPGHLRGEGACPACGKPVPPSARLIAACEICGHRWLNRSGEDHRAAGNATFKDDYSGYRPDPAYREAVARLIQSELTPRVAPPARLLDLGCGAGELMLVAREFGYDPEGVDISPASAKICTGRGLKARAANFLTCDFRGEFDLITMWDVAAHLRNPGDFLDRVRSLLSGRGLLLIKTPGLGQLSVGLANRWPRMAGTLLGAPSHCQYFDRPSLTALLERTGFRELEWLHAGRARTAAAGGAAKRRLARQARGLVTRLSGDANLYVIARPASSRVRAP